MVSGTQDIIVLGKMFFEIISTSELDFVSLCINMVTFMSQGGGG